MLGRTNEVNKSDRLSDKLVVTEHGLLEELALPLAEPGGQLLELVIIQNLKKLTLHLDVGVFLSSGGRYVLELLGGRALDDEINQHTLVIRALPVKFVGVDEVHLEVRKAEGLVFLACL